MGDYCVFDGGQKWQKFDFGTVTAPAGTNAKGAYSTVENPLKVTASEVLLSLSIAGTAGRSILCDLAVEPAGDPLVNNMLVSTGNNVRSQVAFDLPIKLPRGSTLYSRYQMSGTGATAAICGVLRPASLLDSAFKDCDTYGVDTTTSKGTVVTPGGSYTKGAYVQIGTNLTSDVRAVSFAIAHDAFAIVNNAAIFIDIATGVGAATSIILRNLMTDMEATSNFINTKFLGPFMVPVARGQGLWARAAGSAASVDTFCIAAYGFR